MCWKLVSAVLLAILSASPAAAEKRIALVVGNSAYQSVPRLDNPKNDALLVANTLGKLGFSLVGGGAQVDLDKSRFNSVVQSFGNQLMGADVALFYYAGHGLQLRGTNYLVPITANPTRETDVDFQMVDVALVLRQMEGAGTKLNLVVLDACRNNPFAGRGLRASDGGLAQIRAPEGTLLSYATQPGNVALDGDDGHSPYTRALVETMQKQGLDVLQTFNQVGLIVKRVTGNSQQPWVSSSPIDGSFYFSGNAASQVAAAGPETNILPRVPATSLLVLAVPAPAKPGSDFIFPILIAVCLHRMNLEDFRRMTCASPATKSLPGEDAISARPTSPLNSAGSPGTSPTRGIPSLIISRAQCRFDRGESSPVTHPTAISSSPIPTDAFSQPGT